LIRVILETRWDADEWPIVKAELGYRRAGSTGRHHPLPAIEYPRSTDKTSPSRLWPDG
jgi:hypothetical protein